jgi:hypothetical protein
MYQKLALTKEDAFDIQRAAEAEALQNSLGSLDCRLRRRRTLVGVRQVGQRQHIIRDDVTVQGAHRSDDEARNEDMINNGRTAFLSSPALDGMLEGGVPVIIEGQCIGAIGVSGVTSQQDAQIARAGISGLKHG